MSDYIKRENIAKYAERMTRQEQMTVTVRVTDGWMVKALVKQIHTMKWNGRAPGVIVQSRRIGLNEAMNRALNGEDRRVL